MSSTHCVQPATCSTLVAWPKLHKCKCKIAKSRNTIVKYGTKHQGYWIVMCHLWFQCLRYGQYLNEAWFIVHFMAIVLCWLGANWQLARCQHRAEAVTLDYMCWWLEHCYWSGPWCGPWVQVQLWILCTSVCAESLNWLSCCSNGNNFKFHFSQGPVRGRLVYIYMKLEQNKNSFDIKKTNGTNVLLFL